MSRQTLVRVITCLALLLTVSPLFASEQVRLWTQKLQSAKESEARIAQAYLARAGDEAVPELANLAKSANRKLRKRIKETLNLMLQRSVQPDAIQRHPALMRLIEPELRKSSATARWLARQLHYDTGDRSMSGKPRLGPTREAFRRLISAGGFAVPAALELLKDPLPGSRTYGINVLVQLDAVAQLGRVCEIANDAAPVVWLASDYSVDTTVGELAKSWCGETAPHRPKTGLSEAEWYVQRFATFKTGEPGNFRVLTYLRQHADTYHATSWDDFWRRAEPALAKLWDR